MAQVLMERDEANPGSWTEWLREFIAEEPEDEQLERGEPGERDDRDPSEADEPEETTAPGLGRRVSQAAGTLVPRQAVDRLASMPTPGGLGLIVLTIVFLVFAVVPVTAAGDTRLVLIWKTFTGGITIPPGPRKRRAQANQQQAAADVAAGAVSLVEQGFADTVTAFDTFWTDHVIG